MDADFWCIQLQGWASGGQAGGAVRCSPIPDRLSLQHSRTYWGRRLLCGWCCGVKRRHVGHVLLCGLFSAVECRQRRVLIYAGGGGFTAINFSWRVVVLDPPNLSLGGPLSSISMC